MLQRYGGRRVGQRLEGTLKAVSRVKVNIDRQKVLSAQSLEILSVTKIPLFPPKLL